MPKQTQDKPAFEGLPPALTEVALIDARTAAAVGAMSTSWWIGEVRKGRAPQPVLRANRCTRWSLASVREFWAMRAVQGADPEASARLLEANAKASAAARAKQLATQGGAR